MQWPASARSGGQPAAADYPRGREDRGNISFSYMGFGAEALRLVPRGDPGSCTHETDWLGGWEGYYDRDECTKVQGCGSEMVCHHVLCAHKGGLDLAACKILNHGGRSSASAWRARALRDRMPPQAVGWDWQAGRQEDAATMSDMDLQ